jgi:phosphate butyryltransferase
MGAKLEQIVEQVRSRGKRKLAAAYANDAHTICAVDMAVERGIVDGILVGDAATIRKVCAAESIDADKFTIINEPDETKSAVLAVEMVRSGSADVLMKGLLSTDKYMRAILNKEHGLLPPKAMLSHVCLLEVSVYPKLLAISDIAVIPAPDLKQKIAMVNTLIKTMHTLGVECPKVAILTATEQMMTGMPACVDAAIIAKMADRGQIRGAVVDGPLSLDVALDKEAAEIKKVQSPVAGNADALLFHSIEAANAFFKTATKWLKCEMAGMVTGAQAPCVLTSRGDSTTSKLYSIALCTLMAK